MARPKRQRKQIRKNEKRADAHVCPRSPRISLSLSLALSLSFLSFPPLTSSVSQADRQPEKENNMANIFHELRSDARNLDFC